MRFVVRRLQQLRRDRRIPLYLCFIDLEEAYISVDQALLWVVFARFGVPEMLWPLSAKSPRVRELACVRMTVSTLNTSK